MGKNLQDHLGISYFLKSKITKNNKYTIGTILILDLIEPINLRATLLSGQAFRWKYKSGWFDGVIGDTGIRLREISDMKIEFYCEPDKEEHFTKQLLDYLGYQYLSLIHI